MSFERTIYLLLLFENITDWQSTYGYVGSYLGWDPSAYQYGMLTYENVSVDSKECSAGIFP